MNCKLLRKPIKLYSWVYYTPWRRQWQPTPVFLPGESHGQRSLVGYSPWGRKESDTTEWLHPLTHSYYTHVHTYMHVHVHGCMTLQNMPDATVNQWTTRHNTNVQFLQLVKRHNLLKNVKKRLWVFLVSWVSWRPVLRNSSPLFRLEWRHQKAEATERASEWKGKGVWASEGGGLIYGQCDGLLISLSACSLTGAISCVEKNKWKLLELSDHFVPFLLCVYYLHVNT